MKGGLNMDEQRSSEWLSACIAEERARWREVLDELARR